MPAPKDPIKRAEWIENIRKAHIGSKHSKETIANMRGPRPHTRGEKNSMFGRKHKPDCNCISCLSKRGEYKPSEETNAKRVESRKNNGKPWHTKEAKANIGKSLKNHVVTKEAIEKNRKAHKGENHPNFKGGVNESTGYHWTCNTTLITEVRNRDNQTCQVCGRIWVEGDRKFDTHHIYGDEDRKEPCDATRLITLCRSCHNKANKNFADYIFQFETIVNQGGENRG